MRYQVVIVERPRPARRGLFGRRPAGARETLYGEAGTIEVAAAILAIAPFYASERVEVRDTMAARGMRVVAWKGGDW